MDMVQKLCFADPEGTTPLKGLNKWTACTVLLPQQIEFPKLEVGFWGISPLGSDW